MQANNTSGHTGVYWNGLRGKWYARIVVSGESKNLGHFLEKDEAIAARLAAEIKYGFHENHGKDL